MRLVDTHCHPQIDDYDPDRSAMLRRSLDAGVGIIAIGTNLADSLAGVRLAEAHPDEPVYATVGVHPTDEAAGELRPDQLAALLGSRKIVGLGETGLDYYRLAEDDVDARDTQADLFEQHILLAKRVNLPLVIHCRDRNGFDEAYQNVLVMLRRHQVNWFVMHCYGGDWAAAEQFLELGGMISVTGIITFPNSAELQSIIKKIPTDRLMLETDAPFLAPVPHRGKRNEPAWVEEVAKSVAMLRNTTVDDVAQFTTENAQRFFNLTTGSNSG